MTATTAIAIPHRLKLLTRNFPRMVSRAASVSQSGVLGTEHAERSAAVEGVIHESWLVACAACAEFWQIVPIRKCFLLCCECVRSVSNRHRVPIRLARSGAGERGGKSPAIRNAFGIGTEGVGSVFNIFSPAIRKRQC